MEHLMHVSTVITSTTTMVVIVVMFYHHSSLQVFACAWRLIYGMSVWSAFSCRSPTYGHLL